LTEFFSNKYSIFSYIFLLFYFKNIDFFINDLIFCKYFTVFYLNYNKIFIHTCKKPIKTMPYYTMNCIIDCFFKTLHLSKIFSNKNFYLNAICFAPKIADHLFFYIKFLLAFGMFVYIKIYTNFFFIYIFTHNFIMTRINKAF